MPQTKPIEPTELLDIVSLERELCGRHLIDFAERAWPILEPGASYVGNWHIEAICEHLEAISSGQILRLLINMPPRCMKSLLTSVIWPAWVWINQPHLRWLCASYAQNLSIRDSLKTRQLIKSQWYQQRWSDKFAISKDQDAKIRFENDKLGFRLATSVDGLATGEGGDIQNVDDPHNVKEAESDAVREGTITWLSETMATRFNNPKLPRRVITMQRIHSRDCSGHVIAEGGYEHLCLPMRFEKSRLVAVDPQGTENPFYIKQPTALGFSDPRTEEGELLWPDRFDLVSVEDLEHRLGPYGTAGQLQQRPTPRGGGMIKREQLQIIDELPKDVVLHSVRSWDFAGTDPSKQISYTNPDWTVGIGMGKTLTDDPDIYIWDNVRFRADPGERDDMIVQTARLDGVDVAIWVEQEPGQSGKSQIVGFRSLLPGYALNPPQQDMMPTTPGSSKPRKETGVPTGNKVTRAEAFATHCHRRKVYIVRGPWTAAYVQELTTFPLSDKKDQMDATSQGFNKLMARTISTAEAMANAGFYGR